VMSDVIAEFGELVENEIIRVAPKFCTFVVDFLNVAFGTRGLDDVLWAADPGAQPLEAFFAHAGGQYRNASAIEDTGYGNAAAAVISCRRPDCFVAARRELAGHKTRNETTISRQHLVRADHRKKAAESHNDRRANPGQFGRSDKIGRGRRDGGTGAVVVPVYAEQIGCVWSVWVDR